MPSISEIIVQELLSERCTYKDRYTLSIKIANKDLQSQKFSEEEKTKINDILQSKGVHIRIK
jgi:hypothetical protein